MSLHFLVSIGSESENLYGVRFLCSFMGEFQGCNVTLFHVSDSDKNNSSSLLSTWESPEQDVKSSLSASARKALNKSKRTIEAGGLDIFELRTKVTSEQFGKVKDILHEGANGLYDAMILGMRTTYTLQWMFERTADEIAQALIRDASLSSPIWICREPETSRKNVLLCLDGSSSALRMADHVGYILSFATNHNITILHVSNRLAKESEKVFNDGIDILSKHGIAPHRIVTKTARGLSVVNTILAEKNSGKYAAVAVGLNGKTAKAVLDPRNTVGKNTSTLVSKISKAALWCCP